MKIRILNISIIITIFIAIIFLCISFTGFKEQYETKKEYENIKENVFNTNISKKDKSNVASPNFNKLREINPDITCWITIPNTSIDYPVVMAKNNNNFYLNHDIKGLYSQYGSIFTDYRLYGNPLNSKNCIIYGHNMGRYTDSMFSSLINFRDKKYYKKHKDIYIYTEKGMKKYKIISIMKADNESSAYNLTFETDDEYKKWVKECVEKSMIECNDVNITDITNVVTLSTCIDNSDKLVIMGAKVK